MPKRNVPIANAGEVSKLLTRNRGGMICFLRQLVLHRSASINHPSTCVRVTSAQHINIGDTSLTCLRARVLIRFPIPSRPPSKKARLPQGPQKRHKTIITVPRTKESQPRQMDSRYLEQGMQTFIPPSIHHGIY